MPQSWDYILSNKNLCDTLKSHGYTHPTPVQYSTIPLFLANKDVCVESITGSGKTLSFVVPLLHKLISLNLEIHQIKAVIISPTRDLSNQIYLVLKALINSVNNFSLCPIKLALFTGGGTKSLQSDLKYFYENGANILVCTPGRLHYMLEAKESTMKFSSKNNQNIDNQADKFEKSLSVTFNNLIFQHLEYLVLDEGDKLLDFGFMPTIQSIINYLPKQRRTCLFSATLNDKLDILIQTGLRNPVSIVVKERYQTLTEKPNNNSNIPSSLNFWYHTVAYTDKLLLLSHLLFSPPQGNEMSPLYMANKILIFVNNHYLAQYITTALKLYLQDLISFFTAKTSVSSQKRYLTWLSRTCLLCLHRKLRTHQRSKTISKFQNIVEETISTRIKPLNFSKSKRRKLLNKTTTSSSLENANSKRLVMISTDVMARGIDIKDIDWVIHYDPPSDIEKFIHRSGRTARISSANCPHGKPSQQQNDYLEQKIDDNKWLSPMTDSHMDSNESLSENAIEEMDIQNPPSHKVGNSLLLLYKGQEETFIDFLALNQGIRAKNLHENTLNETDSLGHNINILSLIHNYAHSNPPYMLKGIKAFVSTVRSYGENSFSVIFRVRDLPLGQLATGFGLLYLPSMPEIAKLYRQRLKQSKKDGGVMDTSLNALLDFLPPFPEIKRPVKKQKNVLVQQNSIPLEPIIEKEVKDNKENNTEKTLTRKQRAKLKKKQELADIAEFAKDIIAIKKLKKKQEILHTNFRINEEFMKDFF